MCEIEIVSCRVLNISPTITALLRKVHCKVIFGVPEGIRQAAPWKRPIEAFLLRGTQSAGHGLFESSLLLPHKIHAKQKEQHPIRCCSWCDREDSNLWPSGSENYDKAAQTDAET